LRLGAWGEQKQRKHACDGREADAGREKDVQPHGASLKQ